MPSRGASQAMLPHVPTNAFAPATICVCTPRLLLRRHPRSRADDLSFCRERVVGVIVFEHETGIEKDDRQPLRE
jgi:hypothetical protein